jgi:hypothetical protein
VSLIGTLSLAVAVVQSDTATVALRRAALARARVRLRAALSTTAGAVPRGVAGTVALGSLTVHLEDGRARATLPAPALRRLSDGRPLELATPR